jgi:hypothetical protein
MRRAVERGQAFAQRAVVTGGLSLMARMMGEQGD